MEPVHPHIKRDANSATNTNHIHLSPRVVLLSVPCLLFLCRAIKRRRVPLHSTSASIILGIRQVLGIVATLKSNMTRREHLSRVSFSLVLVVIIISTSIVIILLIMIVIPFFHQKPESAFGRFEVHRKTPKSTQSADGHRP